MKAYDVIVVGAGPAGSALASHLARDGFSVLLLEKGQFPRDKVCGDLVSAKGLKLLESLGCRDEIENRRYAPIRQSAVFIDGEELVRARLPRIPAYAPHGYAIPRIELDEIICASATRAGATCVERCEVTDFEIGRSGVRVHATVRGTRVSFRGALLVGADGANSIVARRAGLEMRDPRYVQLAIRSYCTGLPLSDAVLFFAEDYFPGYGWAFPVNGVLTNVGVGMVKESASRDSIPLKRFFSLFARFIRNMARERGVEIELSRPAGWPIKTYGGAQRNYFERGLLIGDAGCFVDPVSGEGIPLALETAAMAADTIRESFTRGDFGVSTLMRYERRWRAHYDADLGVSDLVVSTIRNRRLVKLWINWLRVMGMTAARDEAYALKVGGILAGLVPNRLGLSSDIMLKSVVHGPAFWAHVLELTPSTLPRGLFRQTADLMNWQRQLATSMVTEFDWYRDWAMELGRKQLKVLTAIARSGKP